VSNKDVLRIERLIRLATDSAVSEAEARTSAFVAVKSIQKSGLKLCEVCDGDGGPKKLKRKKFKARRELKFTLHGLERRVDHIEEFIGKAEVVK
jgi:hypothetical protein